jgi:hypothetical protein
MAPVALTSTGNSRATLTRLSAAAHKPARASPHRSRGCRRGIARPARTVVLRTAGWRRRVPGVARCVVARTSPVYVPRRPWLPNHAAFQPPAKPVDCKRELAGPTYLGETKPLRILLSAQEPVAPQQGITATQVNLYSIGKYLRLRARVTAKPFPFMRNSTVSMARAMNLPLHDSLGMVSWIPRFIPAAHPRLGPNHKIPSNCAPRVTEPRLRNTDFDADLGVIVEEWTSGYAAPG